MTKEELIKLLNDTDLDISEGEQDDINKANTFPRILFFDYVWDFDIASSNIYNTVSTYQISFFSRIPRNPKLLNLIKTFLDNGVIISQIQHEFVEKSGGFWHSYFSVQVIEDLLCSDN